MNFRVRPWVNLPTPPPPRPKERFKRWSVARFFTEKRDFSDSVHFLGMPVLYRLICMVCGLEGPCVEFFKVRLMSQ